MSSFQTKTAEITGYTVFILKTLINKYVYKCKKKLYVCFVDFKKAFDSVWRSALFLKLRAKGIKG